MTEKTKKIKSRAGLIGLLAVFFVPLILALVMYFNLDVWQHPERSNYGELMLPIEPLNKFSGIDVDNQVVGLDAFGKIWSLVYVGQGGCDIYCETTLFVMRQARSRLSQDMTRLQLVYLAADDVAFSAAQALQQRHPAMRILKLATEDAGQLLQQFDFSPNGNAYLIDPHSNKVLRYREGSSTKGVYSDLHKLLENSRIG